MPETTRRASGPINSPPSRAARYAVSDIHGHPQEFLAALQRKGLVDATGYWSGGTAQLWSLGDYFDRGPDGVAVVDHLIRLQQEASAAGGEVTALLGNHEVLTLGMHRFGTQTVTTPNGDRSFEASWARNQGQGSDQSRLTERHLDWLENLPAMVKTEMDILIHSDIVSYRNWGEDVAAVNQQVRLRLRSHRVETLWQLWSDLTQRRQFRGGPGAPAATAFLAHFGGNRIVHGHSIIGEAEERPATENTSAESYGVGQVLAIDGGLFAGGPCLVVEL